MEFVNAKWMDRATRVPRSSPPHGGPADPHPSDRVMPRIPPAAHPGHRAEPACCVERTRVGPSIAQSAAAQSNRPASRAWTGDAAASLHCPTPPEREAVAPLQRPVPPSPPPARSPPRSPRRAAFATGCSRIKAWHASSPRRPTATVSCSRTAPAGEIPTAIARRTMTDMARYRTRARKGIFVYASHAEANRDSERWVVDAIIETERLRSRPTR